MKKEKFQTRLIKLGAITMLVPPVGIYLFARELRYQHDESVCRGIDNFFQKIYINNLEQQNKDLTEQLNKSK